MADGGLAVEPLPRQLYAQVQSGGTAGKNDRIIDLCFFGGDALDLIDILTHSAHPVGGVCFGHVCKLLPMHGGGGEPDLLFKGGKFFVSGKSHSGTSSNIIKYKGSGRNRFLRRNFHGLALRGVDLLRLVEGRHDSVQHLPDAGNIFRPHGFFQRVIQ